jgi:uncharacterized protein YhfF
VIAPHRPRILRSLTPGPTIGSTPTTADEGAEAVLDGTKTTTSLAVWDYPDGRIPIVGALSVLLDGQGRTRAIVKTERVDDLTA